MCAILGYIDLNKNTKDDVFKSMLLALSHRGPDNFQTKTINLKNCDIGLGHCRLSILDLSNMANQPMAFQDYIIIYNGEIYNFKEIRLDLISKGYNFSSDSDTEVIIKSYDCWKEDCVHKFNGMFSIVIFDSIKKRIFIARDRLGVKPLYYYKKNNIFIFSSEIKAFHKHPLFEKKINVNSVNNFFSLGYIPQNNSIFNDCFKIPPGCFAFIDINDLDLKIKKYWDIDHSFEKKKTNLSEEQVINDIENLLYSSVEYRLISDVPVGVFLSGGYDSSLIAAISQKLSRKKVKTFNIGFNESKYDESKYAKNIAEYLGTDHYSIKCTPDDSKRFMNKISETWDEPFGDPSVLPSLMLSEMTRGQVKVALSSDGGDELFCGYDKYYQSLSLFNFNKKYDFLSILLKKLLPNNLKIFNKIERFSSRYKKFINSLNSKDIVEILQIIVSTYDDRDRSKLLSIDTSKSINFSDEFNFNDKNYEELDKLLIADIKTYQTDDILKKVDMSSMAYGLESREPLLDHRLFEYMFSINNELKFKNFNKKYLQKKIAHKHIDKSLLDRPKMGFGVPVFNWLKNDLKIYLDHYLSEKKVKENYLLNFNEVKKIKDKYERGDGINIYKIWYILIFQMWFEKWII